MISTELVVVWFVKTSRTDKRFPPRGVCLLIQDSLLLQMLLQGTARPTTETSPEFLLGIIRAVPGRRSWNLSRNSVTMVQPCPSPVPDAFGPHGSSEHIRPSAA